MRGILSCCRLNDIVCSVSITLQRWAIFVFVGSPIATRSEASQRDMHRARKEVARANYQNRRGLLILLSFPLALVSNQNFNLSFNNLYCLTLATPLHSSIHTSLFSKCLLKLRDSLGAMDRQYKQELDTQTRLVTLYKVNWLVEYDIQTISILNCNNSLRWRKLPLCFESIWLWEATWEFFFAFKL